MVWTSAMRPSVAELPPPPAQAQAVTPAPFEKLLDLAGQCLDSGRLKEAENLLDHILWVAPDTAEALNLKGVLLFRTNRNEAAAALMEHAVEISPRAVAFRRNLCPIYERIGRYDDALRVGRQVLAADPVDLQTL